MFYILKTIQLLSTVSIDNEYIKPHPLKFLTMWPQICTATLWLYVYFRLQWDKLTSEVLRSIIGNVCWWLYLVSELRNQIAWGKQSILLELLLKLLLKQFRNPITFGEKIYFTDLPGWKPWARIVTKFHFRFFCVPGRTSSIVFK